MTLGAAPPTVEDRTGGLDAYDRVWLLEIARAALRTHLRRTHPPIGQPHHPAMLEHAAAFVTVYVGGELRGCVGRLERDQELYRTIGELAIAAATRDPRFDPVTLAELDDVRLEISVLSPLCPWPAPRDPAALVLGRDGLVVERGAHRGLLLPKVAVEHGFDAQTFLAETCHKAGLPHDAWRDPETEVATFRAEVFAETDETAAQGSEEGVSERRR